MKPKNQAMNEFLRGSGVEELVLEDQTARKSPGTDEINALIRRGVARGWSVFGTEEPAERGEGVRSYWPHARR